MATIKSNDGSISIVLSSTVNSSDELHFLNILIDEVAKGDHKAFISTNINNIAFYSYMTDKLQNGTNISIESICRRLMAKEREEDEEFGKSCGFYISHLCTTANIVILAIDNKWKPETRNKYFDIMLQFTKIKNEFRKYDHPLVHFKSLGFTIVVETVESLREQLAECRERLAKIQAICL